MMKCEIQFLGKESHDTKSFKDNNAALEFILRNREKIRSVNYQPILVFGVDAKLRPLSIQEIEKVLEGRDPFEE